MYTTAAAESCSLRLGRALSAQATLSVSIRTGFEQSTFYKMAFTYKTEVVGGDTCFVGTTTGPCSPQRYEGISRASISISLADSIESTPPTS
jgi:hypothetical protein